MQKQNQTGFRPAPSGMVDDKLATLARRYGMEIEHLQAELGRAQRMSDRGQRSLLVGTTAKTSGTVLSKLLAEIEKIQEAATVRGTESLDPDIVQSARAQLLEARQFAEVVKAAVGSTSFLVQHPTGGKQIAVTAEGLSGREMLELAYEYGNGNVFAATGPGTSSSSAPAAPSDLADMTGRQMLDAAWGKK